MNKKYITRIMMSDICMLLAVANGFLILMLFAPISASKGRHRCKPLRCLLARNSRSCTNQKTSTWSLFQSCTTATYHFPSCALVSAASPDLWQGGLARHTHTHYFDRDEYHVKTNYRWIRPFVFIAFDTHGGVWWRGGGGGGLDGAGESGGITTPQEI